MNNIVVSSITQANQSNLCCLMIRVSLMYEATKQMLQAQGFQKLTVGDVRWRHSQPLGSTSFL